MFKKFRAALGLSIATAMSLGSLVFQPQVAQAATFDPKADYSVNFNGSNAYGESVGAVIPTTGDYTVEAWVYNSSASDAMREIIAQGDDVNSFYMGDIWGGTRVAGANELPPIKKQQWFHIAVTHGSNGSVVWVNGQAIAKAYGLGNPGDYNLNIGRQFLAYGEFWKGKIDEVKIWNVDRTNMVASDMNTYGGGMFGTGLVAYYDFNTPTQNQDGTFTIPDLSSAAGLHPITLYNVTANDFVDVAEKVDWGTDNRDALVTFPRPYLNAQGGWTSPSGYISYKALVVGGGGGGGAWIGGGGAGGMLTGSTSVDSGSFAVSVGTGGTGANSTTSTAPTNGGSSSVGFVSTVAYGGGNGAGYTWTAGNGGSGGGSNSDGVAAGTGTTGQGYAGGTGVSYSGNDGGWAGGGGGGAGAAGISATRTTASNASAGNGGAGLASSITGSSVYYAGGGGGALSDNASGVAGTGGSGGGGNGGKATIGANGTANTGGGGGGGGHNNAGNFAGGSGGSGIVVVRYMGSASGTGGTVASGTGTAAGYTLHTFTSTGASTLALGGLNVMLSGVISGSGSMVNNATGGKISLMGTNTYTGATTLSGGTLGIYNMSAISAGALIAENNTTLLLGRTITGLTNNITLNGAVTVAYDNKIDYLVVGGGGGGASDGGGGGGGGAIVSKTGIDIGSAISLTATVGGGGNFGAWATGAVPTAGGNSSLNFGSTTETATGGSGGTNGPSRPGGAGGSGNQSTSNGGAGGAGSAGTTGLAGGTGPTSNITGTLTNYGGGGGGGVTFTNSGVFTGGAGGAGGGGAGTSMNQDVPTAWAAAGTANTGGGGGAGTASYLVASAGDGTGYRTPGAAGGSGLVVVRYMGGDAAAGGTGAAGTGSAVGYTLHTFTTTGANTLTLNPLAATFSGAIGGTGSFVANPSAGGKFIFTGANTYSGGSTISSGTLQWASTWVVTEPTTSVASAPWPWEPITTRSNLPCSASLAMEAPAGPTFQLLLALMPWRSKNLVTGLSTFSASSRW